MYGCGPESVDKSMSKINEDNFAWARERANRRKYEVVLLIRLKTN